MRFQTNLVPLGARRPGAPFLKFALTATNIAPITQPNQSTDAVRGLGSPSTWGLESDDSSSIYVVDDEPRLTDLYSILLEGMGYVVRSFNSRIEALASLKGERLKPDLLIMDYLGHAMSAERFMRQCLLAHPALRILMATGFSRIDTKFSCVSPDRFLQKPFTAEEFLHEVKAALVP